MEIQSVLRWLQETSVANGIRNSLLLFPLLEAVHVFGLALVVGTITVIDLRLLGLASTRRPFHVMAADILQWTWVAFGITVFAGALMFTTNAQVYFAKWGLANGKDEIGRLFGDVGGTLKAIRHDYAAFNWIMTGGDVFACEGTSYGEHRDGAWRAGVTHAGRWCDVFEVRDFLIQRCFIYLDPDYAGLDTDRYPWLSADGRDASQPIG